MVNSSRPRAQRMNVAKLFEFSSIAIIGASPRNDIAVSVLDGLESIGFSGEVACINPGAESVRGRPAYRSIEDVPFEVDHAVIDIRADRVPAELEKCGRQGVRAVTIHSGGFLEVGDDGIALQLQLAEIAARFGMILCGPNCMGWMSAHDRTAAYCKSRLPNVAGGVGVVAHSGGVLNEILNYGSYRGIAFSKAVSTGNEAVCDVADFLEHLVHDPATTTIGLVLEGVRSPERLWPALALALERGKPVVAIKIGSSKLAAAAAAMHTGADVGSYDEFVAQCETYGVTLVHDIDQLCEALLVFSNAGALVRSGRPPRGVAVIEILRRRWRAGVRHRRTRVARLSAVASIDRRGVVRRARGAVESVGSLRFVGKIQGRYRATKRRSRRARRGRWL